MEQLSSPFSQYIIPPLLLLEWTFSVGQEKLRFDAIWQFLGSRLTFKVPRSKPTIKCFLN